MTIAASTHHDRDKIRRNATLSGCGRYRYWLERCWQDDGGDYLNFIMLNPSTADAEVDDPTVRKCMGFARRLGYIGVHVVNLFAFRATDPRDLPCPHIAVGPENDLCIEAAELSAARTIVAWGAKANEIAPMRVRGVLAMLKPDRTFCLGLNADGSPKHPLYVPYGAPLIPFPFPAPEPSP